MALNKIRRLDKYQLIMAFRENGYDDIAEILKDKDISGQTFLELPTFQLIKWKLPAATINILSKFIEQVKENPSMLIKDRSYPEEYQILPNTSLSSRVKPIIGNVSSQRRLEVNNFKDKLAMTLKFEKPSKLKNDLSPESGVLVGRPKQPKPIPSTPIMKKKLQQTFLNENEPDGPNNVNIIPNESEIVNNFSRSVIDHQAEYIYFKTPVPAEENFQYNIRTRKQLPISGRQQLPIPIEEDSINLKFAEKIELPHSSNSNKTITLPFPREDSKFISDKNKSTSPISDRKQTADQSDVFIPGAYIDESDIPSLSLNKNQMDIRTKLTSGVFDIFGRLITSKHGKNYENYVADDKSSNPSIQNSITSYRNRPLPPIPRDEEIIPNTNVNIGVLRIPESFDDNLMQGSTKDGKATRRSIDFNDERFFRNINRRGAERLLKPLIDGAFLFRPSKKYYLALTIKYKQNFYSFGIERTSHMRIRLTADMNNVSPEFKTLREFTEHFIKEPIAFKDNNEFIEILLEPVLPNNLS